MKPTSLEVIDILTATTRAHLLLKLRTDSRAAIVWPAGQLRIRYEDLLLKGDKGCIAVDFAAHSDGNEYDCFQTEYFTREAELLAVDSLLHRLVNDPTKASPWGTSEHELHTKGKS